jgi:pyrroloquinoline quinone biosynthesis protein B
VFVIVLGAGAGGGFPQWNSAAPACLRARAGDAAARACTQTSIAVSAEGRHWFIVNASPDVRWQIERTAELHPVEAPRSTPIAGVVLAGAEVDAIAGLLTLREGQAFGLFATAATHARLDANPIFGVLRRDVVRRVTLAADVAQALPLVDGSASGLSVRAFAVPGKVPLYAEGEAGSEDETVGLEICDGRARCVFVPGCARLDAALLARMERADCLFFDATLWRDDEMIVAGLSHKTGRAMGHMSVSGAEGVMEGLRGVAVGQKWLIHINNSNPILLADSAERAEVEAAGWRVACDGLRLAL